MATFHFDLVSPERILISGEVEQVDVPGADGDFGVFPGHAPMVTTLRPGILTIKRNGGEERIVVLGGFAEVSPNGLTVLAAGAVSVEEFRPEMLDAHIKKSEEKVAKMEQGSLLDRELARLDQMRSVQTHLQTTALH